jgi:hypothetical protein
MPKDNTLEELLETQRALTKAHEDVENARGDKDKACVVYENADRHEGNAYRDIRKARIVYLTAYVAYHDAHVVYEKAKEDHEKSLKNCEQAFEEHKNVLEDYKSERSLNRLLQAQLDELATTVDVLGEASSAVIRQPTLETASHLAKVLRRIDIVRKRPSNDLDDTRRRKVAKTSPESAQKPFEVSN